jgi:hypothetical protein
MRRLFLTALAGGLVACSGSRSAEARTAADTLTRRQKDSLVSTMPIPGASRIRDAQKAADAQRARNALLDSLAR